MKTTDNIHCGRLLGLAVAGAFALFGCSPEAQEDKMAERAESYFEAEEFDKARIEYLNLLRENPSDERAIRQMGLIWMKHGAPMRAIQFLFRASEQAPDDLEVRQELASAFVALQDIASARKEALAVLDQSPSEERAILLLANTSRTKEEVDRHNAKIALAMAKAKDDGVDYDGEQPIDYEVEETKERLKSLDKETNAAFHLATAILAAREGAAQEEVKKSLDQALAIDSNSPSVFLARATYFLNTGDPDQGRVALEKAVDFSPPRSTAKLRYIEFLGRVKEMDLAQQEVEELTTVARDFIPGWTLKAELAGAANKADEALQMLKEVFARDPMNVQANRLKARILLSKNDIAGAVEILDRISELYPGLPGLKIELAQVHRGAGDLEKARIPLRQILAIDPNFSEALLLLALIDRDKGEGNAAVASLRKLLEANPGHVQAQLVLANIYQRLGQLDEAAAIYRNRIEAGDGAGPYFMLGKLERSRENPDVARQYLEKAQELAPLDPTITFDLVDLDIEEEKFEEAHRRVQASLDRGPNWQAYYLKGRILFAEKKWQEAEATLSKALELKPGSITVYNLMVDIALAKEQPAEAIARLESLLKANPESFVHLMPLAMICERGKDFAEAARHYRRLLAIEPDFVPALNNLAYLLAGPLDQLAEAQVLAAKARSLDLEHPGIADTLGWIFYKQKEYQQALDLLEEAVGKAPGVAEIQFHVGMARYMVGSKQGAREALEKAVASEADFTGKAEAIERLAFLGGGIGGESSPSEAQTVEQLDAMAQKQPDDPLVRIQLGLAHETKGSYQKAAAAFEAALKINSDLVAALTGLARLYVGPLDDLEKAGGFARKARTLAPNDPEIAGVLGRVTLREGNYAYALGLLREAIEKTDDDIAVRLDFAHAAYSLGRVDDAREAMRRVADLKAGVSEIAEAKEFLSMTTPPQGDWENLGSAAERKLAEDPEYVPALMIRGALHESRGETRDAIGTYEGVLGRYPDFVPVQVRLAALWGKDPERLDEARGLAIKAREAMPDDAGVARVLGEISYRQGENKYAIRLLEESATEAAIDAEGLFYLGKAYLEVERTDDGRETLRKALEAGLDAALAKEVRVLLTQLDSDN